MEQALSTATLSSSSSNDNNNTAAATSAVSGSDEGTSTIDSGVYFEAGRVKFEGLEMSLLLSSQENAALNSGSSSSSSSNGRNNTNLCNAAGYIPIGASITSTGSPHPSSVFSNGGVVKGLLVLKVTRPIMIKGLYVKLAGKSTVIKKNTQRPLGHNSFYDDDSVIFSLSKVSHPILPDPYSDNSTNINDDNNNNDNRYKSKNTAVFGNDSLFHTFLGFSECDNDHGQLVELPSSLNGSLASSSRLLPSQRKRHVYSFRFYLPDKGPISYCAGTSSVSYELSAILDTPLISSVVSQIQFNINVAHRGAHMTEEKYIAGMSMASNLLSRQRSIAVPLKTNGLLSTFKSFFKSSQQQNELMRHQQQLVDQTAPHMIIKSAKRSTFPFKTFEYNYPLEIAVRNLDGASSPSSSSSNPKKSHFVTVKLVTQVISRFSTADSFADVINWYYNKYDGVEEASSKGNGNGISSASFDKGSVTSYLIEVFRFDLSKAKDGKITVDIPIKISTYEYYFSVTNWPKMAPISYSPGYIVSPSFEGQLSKVRTVIEVVVHKDQVTEFRVPNKKLIFERAVVDLVIYPTAAEGASTADGTMVVGASSSSCNSSSSSSSNSSVASISATDKLPLDPRRGTSSSSNPLDKENSPMLANKSSARVKTPVAETVPLTVKSHIVPQVSLAMVLDRFNRNHDHLDPRTNTPIVVASMCNLVVLDDVEFFPFGGNSTAGGTTTGIAPLEYSPVMVDPIFIDNNVSSSCSFEIQNNMASLGINSSSSSDINGDNSNSNSNSNRTSQTSGPESSHQLRLSNSINNNNPMVEVGGSSIGAYNNTINTCRSLISHISNSPALSRLAGRHGNNSGVRRGQLSGLATSSSGILNLAMSGGGESSSSSSSTSVVQRLDFDSIMFSSSSASNLLSARGQLDSIREASPSHDSSTTAAARVSGQRDRRAGSGGGGGLGTEGDNLVYPYYSSMFSPRLVPSRIEEI